MSYIYIYEFPNIKKRTPSKRSIHILTWQTLVAIFSDKTDPFLSWWGFLDVEFHRTFWYNGFLPSLRLEAIWILINRMQSMFQTLFKYKHDSDARKWRWMKVFAHLCLMQTSCGKKMYPSESLAQCCVAWQEKLLAKTFLFGNLLWDMWTCTWQRAKLEEAHGHHLSNLVKGDHRGQRQEAVWQAMQMAFGTMQVIRRHAWTAAVFDKLHKRCLEIWALEVRWRLWWPQCEKKDMPAAGLGWLYLNACKRISGLKIFCSSETTGYPSKKGACMSWVCLCL